jgi:NitT/TauT family transport system substrate-binding protein
MKIVQGSFGSQIAMLENGQVDIAIDIEPSVSIAEDKGYPVVFPMGKFTPQQAITGIMTTEDVINKRPELVQKVVDALQEAMNLMYKDPAVALRVGKKIYPDLKPSIIKAAADRMLKDAMYPRSLVVQDDLWQRTLKTRLDNGDLKKPQATDVAVDNRFARKAAATFPPTE